MWVCAACVSKCSDQCRCPDPCSDECSYQCTDLQISAHIFRWICLGVSVCVWVFGCWCVCFVCLGVCVPVSVCLGVCCVCLHMFRWVEMPRSMLRWVLRSVHRSWNQCTDVQMNLSGCVCVCGCGCVLWVCVCVSVCVCGCVCVVYVVCVCVGVCRCVLCVLRVSGDVQINADAQIHAQMSVQISAHILRWVHRCSVQFVWVSLSVWVWVCVVCVWVCGCVCVSVCVWVFLLCVCVCRCSDECNCPDACSDECSDQCTDPQISAQMFRSVEMLRWRCVGVSVSVCVCVLCEWCVFSTIIIIICSIIIAIAKENLIRRGTSKCKMANYGFRGQEPFDPKSGQRPRSRDGCLSDIFPPPCAHRHSDSQTLRQSDMQTLIQSDDAGPVVLTSGDGQCCWQVVLATIDVKSLVWICMYVCVCMYVCM